LPQEWQVIGHNSETGNLVPQYEQQEFFLNMVALSSRDDVQITDKYMQASFPYPEAVI
jgi:hypothetical protein